MTGDHDDGLPANSDSSLFINLIEIEACAVMDTAEASSGFVHDLLAFSTPNELAKCVLRNPFTKRRRATEKLVRVYVRGL